jgi:hypothetical protein
LPTPRTATFTLGGNVCLDVFTQTHVSGNTASSRGDDIFGPYAIC